jgi:hypothetical protein
MRDKTFNMRISAEEAARIDKIAAFYELSEASVIRMLIKREADAIKRGKAL